MLYSPPFQLAWEVLELGRICYAKKLSELEGSEEEEKSKAAEDAAFIHLRLGDLLVVEEKFLEAAEVHSKAMEISFLLVFFLFLIA